MTEFTVGQQVRFSVKLHKGTVKGTGTIVELYPCEEIAGEPVKSTAQVRLTGFEQGEFPITQVGSDFLAYYDELS